jgi:hypothetical protein
MGQPVDETTVINLFLCAQDRSDEVPSSGAALEIRVARERQIASSPVSPVRRPRSSAAA